MASSSGPPTGGSGMIPVATDGNFSSDYRIGPTALTASIFTFLAVALVVAGGRLFLRIRTFHRIGLDDAFLIAAVILFAGSVGITQRARDLDYIQMDVNTGIAMPTSTFPEDMLLYNKLNTAQSMLQWSAIYAVKFSYMLFFLPLISRVRFLEIWWRCVMAILIPSSLVCVFMSIWVCPYYDMSFLQNCVLNGNIISHEATFLDLSTALDIATDVLIISIPVSLLAKVRLEMRRKLALGAVLCLSIFMIIIAAIRFGLCEIPTRTGASIPDTTWLFFWQAMEACTAIIMVSLTAFRSLYGQERAKKGKGGGYDYVNESSVQRNAARRQSLKPPKFSSHNVSSQGSRYAAGGWEDEEELRVIQKAHTRTNPALGMWNHSHDRQTSRDKNPPSPMPESFV